MHDTTRWRAVTVAVGVLLATQHGNAEPENPKPRLDLPANPKPGETHINPIDGAEMVWVPGGEFLMGTDEAELSKVAQRHRHWPPERVERALELFPKHRVTVEGFWMYAKEVTNGQYRKFVTANPGWSWQNMKDDQLCDPRAYLLHWREPERWRGYRSIEGDFPVCWVTWYAAKAYAEWAGGRLPTEAEWEYAARGGKQWTFATSTGELTRELANYWGPESPRATKPVGSYPPNPFGLYEMSGSLSEWCSSLERPYPYSATDGREDPTVPYDDRVRRGGSTCGSEGNQAVFQRFAYGPKYCLEFFGFRPVASPVEAPE